MAVLKINTLCLDSNLTDFHGESVVVVSLRATRVVTSTRRYTKRERHGESKVNRNAWLCEKFRRRRSESVMVSMEKTRALSPTRDAPQSASDLTKRWIRLSGIVRDERSPREFITIALRIEIHRARASSSRATPRAPLILSVCLVRTGQTQHRNGAFEKKTRVSPSELIDRFIH